LASWAARRKALAEEAGAVVVVVEVELPEVGESSQAAASRLMKVVKRAPRRTMKTPLEFSGARVEPR
jgi:hypothetical protein